MLAIIELNESKDMENGALQQETSLRHGLQHMQQSHQANVNHPVTLNMMANHFFLTLDFEKVSFYLLNKIHPLFTFNIDYGCLF